MEKINEIKDLAKGAKLTTMPITGSPTGYPDPETGIAVLGFSTFQEAQEFADAQGGIVSRLEWKGGWQFCHYKGEAHELLSIEEQVYDHTNKGVDGESVVHTVVDFWENEVISQVEGLTYQDIDSDELAEAIRDLIKKANKVSGKIETVIRSGGVAVISTNDLSVIDEVHPCMGYTDDTTRVEIGVTFHYSDLEG